MSCCQEMRQDQQTWLKYLGDKKSWKVKGLVSSPCQAHWTHINSSFERAMLRCCDCNSLQPFHPLRLHQHLIEERGRVQLSHASLRCSTRTCAPMNKKTFLLVWYSFCLPSVFLGRHFRWYSILLDSWVRILATCLKRWAAAGKATNNKNCRPPPPPPSLTAAATTHYYYHDCYYFLQLKIHDFKGYHRFIRKAWNNTNCEIATASVSATWV